MDNRLLLMEYLSLGIPILILWGYITYLYIKYYCSHYYKETHRKVYSMSDKILLDVRGNYGEYLLYDAIKKLEKRNEKFLFNLYIPKGNDKTTEIDQILVSHKGLIVFESKNFSGKIYDSKGKDWTTYIGRKKIAFESPILQNENHIKYLKELLGKDINYPIYSVIVFSKRCELKRVPEDTNEVKVTKRTNIKTTINDIYRNKDYLNDNDIQIIYNTLYPYTKVDESIRKKHIMDIKKKNKDKNIER